MELPEALFDADHPGHYLRRLKTVSITLPSVTGPYTSVNCTLTLLSNSVRHDVGDVVADDAGLTLDEVGCFGWVIGREPGGHRTPSSA